MCQRVEYIYIYIYTYIHICIHIIHTDNQPMQCLITGWFWEKSTEGPGILKRDLDVLEAMV